jgi:predicted choloylglycine hydrolase
MRHHTPGILDILSSLARSTLGQPRGTAKQCQTDGIEESGLACSGGTNHKKQGSGAQVFIQIQRLLPVERIDVEHLDLV